MSRLTEKDKIGNWSVKGLPWSDLNIGATITKEIREKLYGALCKLKDYEDTGLDPEQVYAIDELYLGKCKEVNELKKMHIIVDIIVRATVMGLMTPDQDVERMMDIESADLKFDMKLDEWLAADDFNFAHDFVGIRDNINREAGFPATDFGFFMPRFTGNRKVEERKEQH
jgi:hypothetical protein